MFDTVARGFPNCGVFVTPNISPRTCSLKRPVKAKLRKILPSRLKLPGPRRMLRPLVPEANVGYGLERERVEVGLTYPALGQLAVHATFRRTRIPPGSGQA
jgi:hypothetical protein